MQSNQWWNTEQLYHNWERICCAFILAGPKDMKRRECRRRWRTTMGPELMTVRKSHKSTYQWKITITRRKKYLHGRVMEAEGSGFPLQCLHFSYALFQRLLLCRAQASDPEFGITCSGVCSVVCQYSKLWNILRTSRHCTTLMKAWKKQTKITLIFIFFCCSCFC